MFVGHSLQKAKRSPSLSTDEVNSRFSPSFVRCSGPRSVGGHSVGRLSSRRYGAHRRWRMCGRDHVSRIPVRLSLLKNIKSHNEDRVFINTRLNSELLFPAESNSAHDLPSLRSASQRQVVSRQECHVASMERVSARRRSRPSCDVSGERAMRRRFDGHAGDACSSWCAEHLLDAFSACFPHASSDRYSFCVCRTKRSPRFDDAASGDVASQSAGDDGDGATQRLHVHAGVSPRQPADGVQSGRHTVRVEIACYLERFCCPTSA